MSTPQDPPRRLKQKRRRETQLAAWRAKHAAPPAVSAGNKASASARPVPGGAKPAPAKA